MPSARLLQHTSLMAAALNSHPSQCASSPASVEATLKILYFLDVSHSNSSLFTFLDGLIWHSVLYHDLGLFQSNLKPGGYHILFGSITSSQYPAYNQCLRVSG